MPLGLKVSEGRDSEQVPNDYLLNDYMGRWVEGCTPGTGDKRINKILAGPKELSLVEPSRTMAQGKTFCNPSFRGAFREQLTEAGGT